MLRLFLFLALGFALQLSAVAQTASTSASTLADDQKAVAQDDEPDLIGAIKKGDLAAVSKALNEGASPDATDIEDTPALILAVQQNRLDIAEALLKHHAHVDKIDDGHNSTALDFAAMLGRPDLVKLLIAHGADVNHRDDNGHSVLLSATAAVSILSVPEWMRASFMELSDEEQELWSEVMGSEQLPAIKLLLDAGADPNVPGGDCGQTPLITAAMCGNAELTKLLLAHKAELNIRMDEWTALTFAEKFESQENLKRELNRFGPNRKQAFLTWVALTRPGREEVATLLRKAGAR